MSATGKALAFLAKYPNASAEDLAAALWPRYSHCGGKLWEKSVDAARGLLARLKGVAT